MKLNSQYIGSFIKFMRQRAGLTQSELAGRIGVGSRTISKWEQGRGIPDISLLYSLSLELDVDIESLLAGNLDDIGKEWIGVICFENIKEELDLEEREWECMLSMFLLVGIREVAVLCLNGDTEKVEEILRKYREKGFFKKTWYADSITELHRSAKTEEKCICLLYQPAFLYGMNLTRYMRRAMLDGKLKVLALRQGCDSFMPGICFDSHFSCVSLGKDADSGWHMFPMIFGQGKKIIDFLGEEEENPTIYVEPMERGMLAFSFMTAKDRELARRTLSGIEESQGIKIGHLEEIMHVRGWDGG